MENYTEITSDIWLLVWVMQLLCAVAVLTLGYKGFQYMRTEQKVGKSRYFTSLRFFFANLNVQTHFDANTADL